MFFPVGKQIFYFCKKENLQVADIRLNFLKMIPIANCIKDLGIKKKKKVPKSYKPRCIFGLGYMSQLIAHLTETIQVLELGSGYKILTIKTIFFSILFSYSKQTTAMKHSLYYVVS